MATSINWPTSLPQNVIRGVTCSPNSNTINTNNSTGYDKRRPRHTKRYRNYSIGLELSQSQYEDFLDFFHLDIGYGTLSFNFPDPLFIETTIELRIISSSNNDPFTVSPLGDTDYLQLSFDAESIDERVPTGTPSNIWPLQLPELPLHDGFSQKEQSGVVRDQNADNGIINVRRRFTAVTKTDSVNFVFNKTELIIFEAFYVDQGFGTLPFTIKNPLNVLESIKVRFTSQPYTIEYDNDTLDYSVSFNVEQLPQVI